VTDAEIARLAAFKGMSEHDFIQQFTRLRHDRLGLVLQEMPDGSCVFLDGNDCSVQPVKPQRCRDFPNVWNFPGFQKVCHAIPRQVSEADYRRLVADATSRSPDEAASLSAGRRP
jgi:Fe-S-cluster containining protein